MAANRVWKWLKRIFLVLILLLVILAIAASIPAVQTRLAQVVTDGLSEKLGQKVKVDKVYLRFLNSAELSGFYMEDMHGDTLIYLEKLDLNLKHIRLSASEFHIGKIRLVGLVYKLRRYEGQEEFDQSIILKSLFTSSGGGGAFLIKIDDVLLEESRFVFEDRSGRTIKPQYYRRLGFRLSDLEVSDQNFEIGNLQLLAASDPVDLELKVSDLKGESDHLRLDQIDVHINNSFFEGGGDLLWSEDSTKFNFPLLHLIVEPPDIYAFTDRVPMGLKTMEIRGSLSGEGELMRSDGLEIRYGRSTRIIAEGELESATSETLKYSLQMHPSRILTQDLDILRKFDLAEVPERYLQLGVIRLEANIEGDRRSLIGSISVGSNIGSLSADIESSYEDSIDDLKYKGSVHMTEFDLGFATGYPEFKTFSADLYVDGQGITPDNFRTLAQGEVRSLDIRGVDIDTISLNGKLAYDGYQGNIVVSDPKANLGFEGSYRIGGENISFGFTADVRRIDLSAFGMFPEDSMALLSTYVQADFVGDDIESFRGTIDLSGNTMETLHDYHFVNDIHIKSFDSASTRYTYVRSDIIRAELIGQYKYKTLLPSIQTTINEYLGIEDKGEAQSHFDLDLELIDANPITRIWYPELELGHGIKIEIKHRSDSRMLWGRMEFPSFAYGNYYITDGLIGISRSQNGLLITQDIGSIGSPDMEITGFLAREEINNERIGYEIMWDPDSILKYETYLSGSVWYKDESWNHRTEKGWFVFKDSLWNVAPGLHQSYGMEKTWTIDSLLLFTQSQAIGISGQVSQDPKSSFEVHFFNTELAVANNWIKNKNSRLSGKIDGRARVFDIYGAPYAVSDLSIDSLFFNKEFLGTLDIASGWEQVDSSIQIEAALHRQGINALTLDGGFYPYGEELRMELGAHFEKFKLYVLSKYTEAFLSDLKGFLDGDIRIVISPKRSQLLGELTINKATFKEPLTNVYYNFEGSHTVRLEKNGIYFNDITFRDSEHGTPGVARGYFKHDNLRDWEMDLEIDADNLFVMNTNASHSQYYYGSLWATGGLKVSGPLNDLDIVINAAGEDGSRFSLPLNSSSEVGNNSFVTFISKEERSGLAIEEGRRSVNRAGFEMDMSVAADEGTEVELIFDETVGDILRARGDGDLRITMSKEGNIEMYGDYTIIKGDYLFTLQNILNKRFTLQRGGSIIWTGDPYDADIDLTTTYKLRTDLKPLGVSDSTRRYWVYVDLKMANKLSRPTLAFDVRIPDANRGVQQEVQDVITSTQDELNRQVFSLLVMNSFLTPEYAGNAIANTGNEGYLSEGINANTAEILSNQLSHWVSKLSDDFDLGVNYEQGGDFAPDQVELALSTQLFDDRVTLNSNVGVPVNSPNTSQIVGDVEVEVKVSRDGNFRVKAFNRSTQWEPLDNRYGYIQGVGLVYQASFSNFEELKEILFKKREKEIEEEGTRDSAPEEDQPSQELDESPDPD